jgi:galactonate dehydratase
LQAAIQGKEASSFENTRRDVPMAASAMAGLNMAMLEVVGKLTRAPVYQVLGGPTRNMARALAGIDGETDDAIVATQGRFVIWASAVGIRRRAMVKNFLV